MPEDPSSTLAKDEAVAPSSLAEDKRSLKDSDASLASAEKEREDGKAMGYDRAQQHRIRREC